MLTPINRPTDGGTRLKRRQVLHALGAAGVAGLAGCLASGEVHGRDEDDRLAALDFGEYGEADARYLVPEEMSPTVQMAEGGDGNLVAVIAGSSGLTYEETIDFYQDADGGGDWSIADEGGDDEADGESQYGFSGETDEFEAIISITGFGSQNVTLFVGVEPRR